MYLSIPHSALTRYTLEAGMLLYPKFLKLGRNNISFSQEMTAHLIVVPGSNSGLFFE